MTPREAIRLATSLLGLDAGESARRIARALAWTEIGEAEMDQPVRRGGAALAQRVGLAAALVGDPEVLLFDEPLGALPPDERARLLSIPDRGRTILLAVRDPLGEASVATHVMLLRDGRVATMVPVGAVTAAGHPLNRDGVVAFADGLTTESPPGAAGSRSAAPTR